MRAVKKKRSMWDRLKSVGEAAADGAARSDRKGSRKRKPKKANCGGC